MPDKTDTLEQKDLTVVETQTDAALEQKKKLEEEANRVLVQTAHQESVEVGYHTESFDSEVEALQKKVETKQIGKEEAKKLYDEITKKYDKGFIDKTKTVAENVADTMGMMDKVTNKITTRGKIIGGIGAVIAGWWLVKKVKSMISDSGEKPWYKKTWVWLTGLLGIGALAIYKGESIIDWFKKFFEKDADSKMDDMMTSIVGKLGNGWGYDKAANIITFGGSEYKLDDLMKQGIIVADPKTVINEVESIKNLQEHVKKKENIVVVPDKTNDIEETQEDPESQANIENYNMLVPMINTYIDKHQLGDATHQYEQFADKTVAPGLMIAHLDRTYRSIDGVLTNNSLKYIIAGTHADSWLDRLLSGPKKTVVAVLQQLGAGTDIINRFAKSQGISDQRTALERWARDLTPDDSQIAKEYASAIVSKQAMIIQYIKDVKNQYAKAVGGDLEKMKIFSGTIHELIEASKNDEVLHTIMQDVEKNEKVVENQETTKKKKEYFIEKINKAVTDKEKENVVNEFADVVNKFGFNEWDTLWKVMLGHMFETKASLDMRMMETLYGETFGEYQKTLTSLKQKKGKLSDSDIGSLKQLVNDFYDTIDAVQLDTHVQSYTDTDGRVYGVLDVPVVLAGKKIMKTFAMKWEENGILSVAPLVLGTVALLDLASYPFRKIVNWRAISPTVGALKPGFRTIKGLNNKFIRPEFIKGAPEKVSAMTNKIKDLTDTSIRGKVDSLNKKYNKIGMNNAKQMNKSKIHFTAQDIKKYQNELSSIMKNANPKIYAEERRILQSLKKMSLPDRKVLYQKNEVVKRIVDANGGMKLLNATKRGRMFKVGSYVMMGSWQGGASVMRGDSASETVREVADFGIGMVPIAGDLYDIGMAFRGTDLNGNEMSSGERRTRGLLGLGCGVANVFTFGLGGTAAKGLIKGGTKVVSKMGTKSIAKATTKEVLQEGIKQFGKRALKNGAITAVVGGGIIMGADMMVKEVDIDEVENVDLSGDIESDE